MKRPVQRRDLVLLGGGHTHTLALRTLAMRPPRGVRMTLVSDTGFAPYSGMLPGLVAGHYDFEDTHIDLRRFCMQRGVRFIEAAATGIDLEQRRIVLAGRPALGYDLLSVNIGAQPELDSVPGAREHAVPVKPVSGFYARWQRLLERLETARVGGFQPGAGILVVGGGAGSVELALAMRSRLGAGLPISILCGERLLPAYNSGARAVVVRQCERLDVGIRENCRVAAVDAGEVQTSGGDVLGFEELVWCTGVTPAPWLRESALPCDAQGFVLVDDDLRVQGSDEVFAVGDAAVQRRHPRPRAGVFAVRQAPTLAHNLAATLSDRSLREHKPQQRFLSLLSLGEQRAVADRGALHLSGRWVWRWKDRIDREFMGRFSEPPEPMRSAPADPPLVRCGGCGAKLPAALLREVLDQLAGDFPQALDAEGLKDDAAMIDWSSGGTLVQSVDTLRELVDDPWIMGRILALHALSDLYAMGAEPHSAQVHIGLPYAAPELQGRDLYQYLSGIVAELASAGARLLGGHTLEVEELSLGLTVNGRLQERALTKQGAREGDRLVLTKPLGTGVIFAAAMAGKAGGATLAAAVDSMLRSNREAAGLARLYGVSACTDVTGFGLLGHLLEMLPGELTARIELERVPLLTGARSLLGSGLRSTLHPGNRDSLPLLVQPLAERAPVLCDPQTSGGLLLAVPGEGVALLLEALAGQGYGASAIGELGRRVGDEPPVVLV